MRSFIRIHEEMIIRYRPIFSGKFVEGASNDAMTKNISVIGICFRTPYELSVNEHLIIELRLPSHETPITPIARVVWTRPIKNGYETGLELMWLDWQTDEQLIFATYINEIYDRQKAESNQEGAENV